MVLSVDLCEQKEGIDCHVKCSLPVGGNVILVIRRDFPPIDTFNGV